MSLSFGYGGEILRIDLSSGRIAKLPTEQYVGRFVGGRGIAAKIYWDEVPPDIHALHSENRLIFANGPMAGFPGIAGSRWEICGKSTQTSPERFCSANLGGRWGAELKFAGYDALVIYGMADRPVYLLVKDDKVVLKDASHLWGKSTFKTRDLLKNELGKSARIVTTGLAGENMVSMATVLTDDDASGTSGFGAVMGSKRLKAIVVMGSKKPVSRSLFTGKNAQGTQSTGTPSTLNVEFWTVPWPPSSILALEVWISQGSFSPGSQRQVEKTPSRIVNVF